MHLRHLFGSALCASLLTVAVSASADWALLPDPPHVKCQAMSFVDAKTGYILQWSAGVPGYFVLHATTDGATFSPVKTNAVFNALPPSMLTTMQFFDANNGIITASNISKTDVLTTSDGGKTWTNIGSFPINATTGVMFVTPNDGFAMAQSGTPGAVITHDGGKTWTPTTSPVSGVGASVLLATIEPGRILAAGSSGGLQALYLSKDEGKTWTKGMETRAGEIMSATFVDAKNGFLYKFRRPGDGELFATTDGGDTWKSTTGGVAGAINLGAERMEWSDVTHGTVFGHKLSATGPSALIAHTADGGKTWTLEATPAAIETDGAGSAGPKFQCSAYPGPSAYAGTMNHWLHNDTEGGLRPPPPDAGVPDSGSDASPTDSAGTDSSTSSDASTSDSSPASDAPTSGDSSSTDGATPPAADGGSGSSGGCELGGGNAETLPGVLLAIAAVAQTMRRRRAAR